MVRSWVAAGALLVAGLTGAAQATPADAVRDGDMEAMIPHIIALYEDSGLSWNHGIEWTIGPFTTTFWFYDPLTDRIEVGAMPHDTQIDAYWQTWSAVLTDGNFDPAQFFESGTEARELARYNQFVLATHESAHAITFRYDYGHLRRHDYAINCREYYADRLTVAILNEQARLDPDMARWRARYHELVVAMGETIPDQYRHRIADFAALEADCALIDVAQPTPQTMQPYASAYFERYRVLLEAELPPMAEVFAAHLEAPHAAAHANVPFAADRDAYELITLAERAAVELGRVYGDEIGATAYRSRAAAFDPDGILWFATLTYDPETRLAALSFDTDPLADAPVVEPAEWHHPSQRLELSALAVLAADRFVVALEHWDRDGPDGSERQFVTWLLAERGGDGWTLTSLIEVPDMDQGVVRRAPGNQLYFMASPEPSSGRTPSGDWRGFSIDAATMAFGGEMAIGSAYHSPAAIDDGQNLYETIGRLLWRGTPDGLDEVVIGNGLAGPRDGIGARAELKDIEVMQWMPDGRALLIDHTARRDGWLVRELRPAP